MGGWDIIRVTCMFILNSISTQKRKVCAIVCWPLWLTVSLPVVSSCWLNRPMGTKEMSRLTSFLALQSALSSDRRSLTYPKSACFQKISRAVSSEWVLTSQEEQKKLWCVPKMNKTKWRDTIIQGRLPAIVSSGTDWIAKALSWVTVLLITPTHRQILQCILL